jgi:hypothetical protein
MHHTIDAQPRTPGNMLCLHPPAVKDQLQAIAAWAGCPSTLRFPPPPRGREYRSPGDTRAFEGFEYTAMSGFCRYTAPAVACGSRRDRPGMGAPQRVRALHALCRTAAIPVQPATPARLLDPCGVYCRRHRGGSRDAQTRVLASRPSTRSKKFGGALAIKGTGATGSSSPHHSQFHPLEGRSKSRGFP